MSRGKKGGRQSLNVLADNVSPNQKDAQKKKGPRSLEKKKKGPLKDGSLLGGVRGKEREDNYLSQRRASSQGLGRSPDPPNEKGRLGVPQVALSKEK